MKSDLTGALKYTLHCVHTNSPIRLHITDLDNASHTGAQTNWCSTFDSIVWSLVSLETFAVDELEPLVTHTLLMFRSTNSFENVSLENNTKTNRARQSSDLFRNKKNPKQCDYKFWIYWVKSSEEVLMFCSCRKWHQTSNKATTSYNDWL